MQTIFRLFFFISIVLIIIGFFESERSIVPPKIVEYRYIPRTMEEEMEEPVSLESIYKNMFDNNRL